MENITFKEAWEKLANAIETGKGRGQRERRWSRPQLQRMMILCLVGREDINCLVNGENESVFMTVGEVAKYLQVGAGAVRSWANKGLLKAYRIGKRQDRRFKRVDVTAFMNGDSDAG